MEYLGDLAITRFLSGLWAGEAGSSEEWGKNKFQTGTVQGFFPELNCAACPGGDGSRCPSAQLNPWQNVALKQRDAGRI